MGKKSRVAICGIGETNIGKFPGASSLQNHAIATKLALEDAGLSKTDIDGVLTVGSLVENWPHHSGAVSEYLGIKPKYTNTMTQGGAGCCTMIQNAEMLINEGVCETVLCIGADNQLSGMTRELAIEAFAKNRHPQFEYPLGLSTPAAYALIAQRHSHEYGTSRETLSKIAVTSRNHAILNPKAQLRDPLTLNEAINSKEIAPPLHLTDCCISSDGGGAVIVTSLERARDLRQLPIQLMGSGNGFSHEHICYSSNLLTNGVIQSGRTAFAQANLTPQDIDVALLYDCFTISVILQLEDYGFCEKGNADEFISNGRIELGGQLPLNTHGGLLAYGNPGLSGGIFHIIEAVNQLRNTCNDRQVAGAKVALVSGIGGIMSYASTIILEA
jgi:acetyl-CoA acetyltransferase